MKSIELPPATLPSSAKPSPASVGRKDDGGKTQWSLLPLGPVKEIIKVLQHGAQKYSRDNWKYVPNARERYYDAAMRHLTAWHEGEKYDRDSGLHSLAHAACCLLFLLWIDKTQGERVSHDTD